jgi:hypothetical protein
MVAAQLRAAETLVGKLRQLLEPQEAVARCATEPDGDR